MSVKLSRRLCSIAIAATLIAVPVSPAFASDYAAPALVVFYTVTTSGGATTVGGGIALTIYLATKSSRADMETYIRNNAVALHHDIILGAGGTTTDLAAAFQIPQEHTALFAGLLRDHRKDLLPLVDPDTLTQERAGQFMEHIAAAMVHYPELATLPHLTITES